MVSPAGEITKDYPTEFGRHSFYLRFPMFLNKGTDFYQRDLFLYFELQQGHIGCKTVQH